MAKFNKRQIIIIAIAAVALLYGAYTVFSGGKGQKDNPKINPVEKSSYVNNIAGDFMKNALSLSDTYIVERAEADWEKNPFWEKSSYREWANKDKAKTTESSTAKIIYSGYIDIGQKQMAVLNGIEYSIGDELEINGYVLKKITALKVVLSNKSIGSELEIPIQE